MLGIPVTRLVVQRRGRNQIYIVNGGWMMTNNANKLLKSGCITSGDHYAHAGSSQEVGGSPGGSERYRRLRKTSGRRRYIARP